MWLLNVQLIGNPETGLTSDLTHLEFDDTGHLRHIQTSLPSSSQGTRCDLSGAIVSLGGVDLQINGALGLPFPDLDDAQDGISKLTKISKFLWEQGIDAYSPTLVTTSIEKFQRALHCLSIYRRQGSPQSSALMLGAHLEGPCLNPQTRGAHPEQYLQPLTAEVMDTIIGDYVDQVAIVTLAPELDATGQTLPALKQKLLSSAVISLGHSLASDTDAEAAFRMGASMVTHAFNAMPPLHHRQPGLLATALTDDQVWCGLIADGQHVLPRMLKLLIQACPEQGLFLVSDALSPLGLPDGDYPWDDRTITVTNGTARLPDGTLSGTTRSLLDGVSNLVKWDCCSPQQAVALATDAPRRAMGLPRVQTGLSLDQFLQWTYDSTSRQLTWQRLSNHPFFARDVKDMGS